MEFGFHTKLGYMTLVNYRGEAPCPVVPREVNGMPVRCMEESFKDLLFITGAVLPDTMDQIGEMLFLGCDGLREFTVPEGYTHIGDRAFCVCRNLHKVVLPPSVKSIGRLAFFGCESLEEINLENVTEIAPGAFFGCKNLKKVTINPAALPLYPNVFAGTAVMSNEQLWGAGTSLR